MLADVVTVFLTGRECPWRCAMCDLWQQTIAEDTPLGAIPLQLRDALRSVATVHPPDATPHARHIKLYNASSFFDPRAVPPADYDAIAKVVRDFSRVIVESHPSLVGPRVDRWLEALRQAARTLTPPRLEVAMGLETAHPDALERLNKRMTVGDFRAAAKALRERAIDVRAFVLVSPPFVPTSEQSMWLQQSIDVAFDAGASVVSLIPTRTGNGTVDALQVENRFVPPTLDLFEHAFDRALDEFGSHGRLFADVWDLERLAGCAVCLGARRARLVAMNETQRGAARVRCDRCAQPEAHA